MFFGDAGYEVSAFADEHLPGVAVGPRGSGAADGQLGGLGASGGAAVERHADGAGASGGFAPAARLGNLHRRRDFAPFGKTQRYRLPAVGLVCAGEGAAD